MGSCGSTRSRRAPVLAPEPTPFALLGLATVAFLFRRARAAWSEGAGDGAWVVNAALMHDELGRVEPLGERILGAFQFVLNGLICIVNVLSKTAVNPLSRLKLRYSDESNGVIEELLTAQTGA